MLSNEYTEGRVYTNSRHKHTTTSRAENTIKANEKDEWGGSQTQNKKREKLATHHTILLLNSIQSKLESSTHFIAI
jgi:hypothetical protein